MPRPPNHTNAREHVYREKGKVRMATELDGEAGLSEATSSAPTQPQPRLAVQDLKTLVSNSTVGMHLQELEEGPLQALVLRCGPW